MITYIKHVIALGGESIEAFIFVCFLYYRNAEEMGRQDVR